MEIPNTAYTINSLEETSNFGAFNVKTSVNDKIKWINEEDYIETSNYSSYSDNVVLNTINLQKLDSIEEGTAVLGDKMIPIGNTYKQRLYRTINLI